MADDEKIAEVYRKIEREKALIHAAVHMKESTSNEKVRASVDSNIRDSKKNITYLEEKMRELHMRKLSHSDRTSGGTPQSSAPGYMNQQMGMPGSAGPTPPPKDGMNQYFGNERGDYGEPPPGGYSQNSSGMMPPRAPYGDPRPFAAMPKARPNFSKLGKIR